MFTHSDQAAMQFCKSPIWDDAVWLATTYRWHPTSEAPPVMGLVFADWAKGIDLFRTWVDERGHEDEYDDIRVAIIEGEIPGQAPGYTIRISPRYKVDAPLEGGGPTPSRARRMHPIPDAQDMLSRFKQEFEKHGEFLLAPVVARDDDRLYFNANQGIIKRELILRQVGEIGPADPDAAVLHPTPELEGFEELRFPTNGGRGGGG